MKKTIITVAALAMFAASAAQAGGRPCRTCSIDIDFITNNSSYTEVAQSGGTAYRSIIWTCESESNAKTKVVWDQSRNENIPDGTTEIFIHAGSKAHPEELVFETVVEAKCSEVLGEPAVIIDRRELRPAFDDRPLAPWEIEEETSAE